MSIDYHVLVCTNTKRKGVLSYGVGAKLQFEHPRGIILQCINYIYKMVG